jgi:hypothetical protein
MDSQLAPKHNPTVLQFTIERLDGGHFSAMGAPLVEPVIGGSMPQVLGNLRAALIRLYPVNIPTYEVLYPVAERQTDLLA